MIKRLLLTAASLLALAAGAPLAQAADLAPKAPARVPVPIYNWTGIYVGANGGFAWGHQDPLNVITNRFDEFTIDYSGGLFGGTAGAQIQLARVVLGFESDIAWAGINGRATFTPTIFGVPQPFLLNAKTSMEWFGTARARVGYAADNWLFYVTGGLSVVGEEDLADDSGRAPLQHRRRARLHWLAQAGGRRARGRRRIRAHAELERETRVPVRRRSRAPALPCAHRAGGYQLSVWWILAHLSAQRCAACSIPPPLAGEGGAEGAGWGKTALPRRTPPGCAPEARSHPSPFRGGMEKAAFQCAHAPSAS